MNAVVRGTFVISWAQSEVDGIRAAPLAAIGRGAVWRWRGEALRVDGPGQFLTLGDGVAGRDLRDRAAAVARRLLGQAAAPAARPEPALAGGLPQQGFVVTDGRDRFVVGILEQAEGARLALLPDRLPPRDRDLFVVDHAIAEAAQACAEPAAAGVTGVTAATRIATPAGLRPAAAIRRGDWILTRDDGPQEILWAGSRRLTGARLQAMPQLRPIRVRSGAIGKAGTEADLVVAPQQRLLIRSPQAQALFGVAEVLLSAADLIDDGMVLAGKPLREVTYVQLMTERHQIIWADGIATESFHPANCRPDMIEPDQRAALRSLLPGLAADPFSCGGPARRSLSASEAAILRFGCPGAPLLTLSR